MIEKLLKIDDRLFKNELGQSTAFIEVSDGWEAILINLVSLISQRVENPSFEEDPDYCYFSQIKEKYGTLSVYFSLSDPIIDSYIEFAEAMSRTTCEMSGHPGELFKSESGYLKTISPEIALVEGYTKPN
jgi:hypothetical protein